MDSCGYKAQHESTCVCEIKSYYYHKLLLYLTPSSLLKAEVNQNIIIKRHVKNQPKPHEQSKIIHAYI